MLRNRVVFGVFVVVAAANGASAQSVRELMNGARTYHVCEAKPVSGCAVWTFRGLEGRGAWENGEEATLRVARIAALTFDVSVQFTSGPRTGQTVRFTSKSPSMTGAFTGFVVTPAEVHAYQAQYGDAPPARMAELRAVLQEQAHPGGARPLPGSEDEKMLKRGPITQAQRDAELRAQGMPEALIHPKEMISNRSEKPRGAGLARYATDPQTWSRLAAWGNSHHRRKYTATQIKDAVFEWALDELEDAKEQGGLLDVIGLLDGDDAFVLDSIWSVTQPDFKSVEKGQQLPPPEYNTLYSEIEDYLPNP